MVASPKDMYPHWPLESVCYLNWKKELGADREGETGTGRKCQNGQRGWSAAAESGGAAPPGSERGRPGEHPASARLRNRVLGRLVGGAGAGLQESRQAKGLQRTLPAG